MDKATYHANLQLLLTYSAILNQIDLDAMLEAMNRAETIGPVLDPTLYRSAGGALRWQIEIVEAALKFQRTVKEIVGRHNPTGMSPTPALRAGASVGDILKDGNL